MKCIDFFENVVFETPKPTICILYNSGKTYSGKGSTLVNDLGYFGVAGRL